MKWNKWTIGLAAVCALAFTGCTTQNKNTVQKDSWRAAVVKTGGGVVLYVSDYYSVTNGAGQVEVFPKYSAITTSNKEPFSLAGLILGYDVSLNAGSDFAYEKHTGSGKGLLADSKYTQLTSDFTSGARFSGSSQLSVGAIDLTINTNAITATGNAGSQLIQGIGAAAGQFVGKAANTAVTGKP